MSTTKYLMPAAKSDLRKMVSAEIKALREEKRDCKRFSSHWHRVDGMMQALLWVKRTVLR